MVRVTFITVSFNSVSEKMQETSGVLTVKLPLDPRLPFYAVDQNYLLARPLRVIGS